MQPPSAPAEEPPYAWVVVWACFGSLAVIFGVAYSFAAFFESFAREFDAQRADVSLVFGLCGLIYFVLGVGGGMLADRFGPRVTCVSGMVLIATGLLGTSLSGSMGAVYLSYGVCIGLGIALVYTPAIGCVQPWFTRRRGLASGIASAGIGAGTLVVPLVASALIAALPWRDAMRLMALGVLVLGVGCAWLMRRAPVASATPVGAGAAGGPVGSLAAVNAPPGLTLRETLRQRSFWWLYAATVLAAPTMFVPFAHVSAAARDAGIDNAAAVGLVGLIGIGSLVGRFAMGAVADRLGRGLTLVLMQGSMGASYLLWGAADGYPAFAVFALWFGLSYGGIVSLLPALCMDLFGARALASVIGTLYSGAALGNLLGPVLAGRAFDQLGGYGLVIGVGMALSVLATVASARVVTPRAGAGGRG
ncbi:MAG: MFS transporter [Rubrivivax sp.]|jgi:MFS family permease|nr:MFS transporter [Rubrivivax sp.]